MSSLKRKNLREGFESTEQGSHLCSIYEKKDKKLEMLSTFMKIGIERNEKCLYLFDESSRGEIMEWFRNASIQVDELVDSGQLNFVTKRESYLKNGYFEPEEMFQLLSKEMDKAIEEGFEGLRATGEMTWIFTGAPGVERLMEYESKLNEFIQGKEMIILCQYNENRFSPEKLLDVIHTHPRIIIDDFLYENHYYMPVEIFATMVKGEVEEDYYRKIKGDIVEEAKPTGNEREIKREGGEESLQNILQTLEKLEQSIPNR